MTFIETGQYFDTMTTVDDPQLTVTETDNGHNWYLDFRVGKKIIDTINLEHISPNIEVDQQVREISLVSKGINTTVGAIIDNAVSLRIQQRKSFKNQSDIALGFMNLQSNVDNF